MSKKQIIMLFMINLLMGCSYIETYPKTQTWSGYDIERRFGPATLETGSFVGYTGSQNPEIRRLSQVVSECSVFISAPNPGSNIPDEAKAINFLTKVFEDETNPENLVNDSWPIIGIFKEEFNVDIGLGIPVFQIKSEAQTSKIGFHAWNQVGGSSVTVTDPRNFEACCKMNGCGQALIISSADLNQYYANIENYIARADGSYKIYTASADIKAINNNLSKSAWRISKIMPVPAQAKSLESIINVPSSVYVDQNGQTTISIQSPTKSLIFSTSNIRLIASSYDEKNHEYNVTIAPRNLRPGQRGFLTIAKNGLGKVDVSVDVAEDALVPVTEPVTLKVDSTQQAVINESTNSSPIVNVTSGVPTVISPSQPVGQ